MVTIGALTKEDDEILMANIENHDVLCQTYALDSVRKHQQSKVALYISPRDIANLSRFNYHFINAKAVLINEKESFNNKIEVDCVVASSKFYELKDIKQERINLFEYLDVIIDVSPFQKVGLVTFQNGIQNTSVHFREMGESVLKNLAERGSPLCIGLHNATNGSVYGLLDDLKRLGDSWSMNPNAVVLLRQLIITLAEVLPEKILWAHIAHSEGGLIANQVLTTEQYKFDQKQTQFIKSRLLTFTYGAVAPVPNVVFKAVNTYSIDDIAMRFAKNYLDKQPWKKKKDYPRFQKYAANRPQEKPIEQFDANLYFDITAYERGYTSEKNNYTLKIVKSEVDKKEQPRLEKDHGFTKGTYQLALERDMQALKEENKL